MSNLRSGLCLPIIVLAQYATAVTLPIHPLVRRQSQSGSGNGTGTQSPGSNGQTPQLWIPAVIVVAILFFLFSFVFTRKGLLSRIRSAAGAREVTADQLAGRTASNTVANAGTTTTAARPPRTGRRARRTPSQISTKSLPVYNKEPGDQELVIFRGPDEDEMPANEREHERDYDGDSDGDADMRDAPMYTAPDTPLLQGHTRNHSRADSNTDTLGSHERGHSHGLSESTIDVSAFGSTVNLMAVRSLSSEMDHHINERASSDARVEDSSLGAPSTGDGTQDPRGQAPPYYEVVGVDEPAHEHGNQQVSGLPPTSASPRSESARRSGFRSFFASFSGSHVAAASVPPVPPLPAGVTPPAHTSSGSGSVQAPEGHTRHRSSASISLAPSTFRPLSRQRSVTTLASGPSSSQLNLALAQTPSRASGRSGGGHVASQSAVSLVSISAPLAHTLTKTEIRYPKGGPTPEQIRMLSSRESLSLGRFAVPYGGAAQAARREASRSASRVDVREGEEPPRFEEVALGESAGGNGNGDRREASDTTMVSRQTVTDSPTVEMPPPVLSTPAPPVATAPPSLSPSPQPPMQARRTSDASSMASFATAAESVALPSPPITPRGPVINVLPGSRAQSPALVTPTAS